MSISFPLMPGIEISLLLLILLGFSIGIISGFAGVGGGFLMTPALIILGFPAQFAVGTSLMWVMANSVIGAIRHRQRGNVDIKLGLLIMAGSMPGVEIGVRLVNWVLVKGLAEETVLIISIIMLLVVGGYTLWESIRSLSRRKNSQNAEVENIHSSHTSVLTTICHRIKIKPLIHLNKSDLTISIWVILGIGLFTGILSGLLGVGGGFIMTPSLIYIMGLPAFLAVGTDLFQIIFASAYGTIRHTMSGNVIIYAALIMILSSAVGVQIGVLGTRYLRGVCMKLILAFSIFIAIMGSIIRLTSNYVENVTNWIRPLEIAVIFGGLGVILILVFGLLFFSFKSNKGNKIPGWLSPFVARNTGK